MSRGSASIPELRLETLQKFIQKYNTPVEVVISRLFQSSVSPSSSIKWESQVGGRGLTPFVAPGSPAPQTSPFGVAQHTAEAAYWKEKMYFDEEFLNNLRKEGTESEYLSSKARLSRELSGLVNRSIRRKEWMFTKMLFSGSFSYHASDGIQISLDYSLPDANQVTLGADYKWSTGSKKDIPQDIIDGKRIIAEACGGKVDIGICNSVVFGYMAKDPGIRSLLASSSFGKGNLFEGNTNSIVGANPQIIAGLLGIKNLIIYDEMFEVRGYLTTAVTASTTVDIYVDNVADFEVGGTLRFHDISAGTYEDETISALVPTGGYITVSTAPATSYKAGEDFVSMIKRFIPDDQFSMFASRVDGQAIAEYKQAPFGNGRNYGLTTDKHDEWDPEGTWIRAQDKGLPILYNRDAIYSLTVE